MAPRQRFNLAELRHLALILRYYNGHWQERKNLALKTEIRVQFLKVFLQEVPWQLRALFLIEQRRI